MKTIKWPKADGGPSILGLGCASFGSRTSSREAVQLIGAALDAGITYFDTAPSYGLGFSEGILGKALAGKRDRTWIATKVGLSPPHFGPLAKATLPLARIIKKLVPRKVSKNIASPEPGSILDDAQSLRASLDRSLQSLRTDYVDVLLLHAYNWRGRSREEVVMKFLDQVLRMGKVRFAGISGVPESVCTAIDECPKLSLIQIAYQDRNAVRDQLGTRDTVINVHSVLSSIVQSEGRPSHLGRRLQGALEERRGVTLVGMNSLEHVTSNADTALALERHD